MAHPAVIETITETLNYQDVAEVRWKFSTWQAAQDFLALQISYTDSDENRHEFALAPSGRYYDHERSLQIS